MTRAQLKAARAVLGLGVHDVARRLKMGNSTIVKVESPQGAATVNASTVHALVSFYEAHGVEFFDVAGTCGVKWSAVR